VWSRVRFQWPRMSWRFVGLRYLLLIAGTALTAWGAAVNRFFEAGVRIQTDRCHHGVETGPYATVRQPGYFAACLLFTGIALWEREPRRWVTSRLWRCRASSRRFTATHGSSAFARDATSLRARTAAPRPAPSLHRRWRSRSPARVRMDVPLRTPRAASPRCLREPLA
jgi:Phospholipid methyltransferase